MCIWAELNIGKNCLASAVLKWRQRLFFAIILVWSESSVMTEYPWSMRCVCICFTYIHTHTVAPVWRRLLVLRGMTVHQSWSERRAWWCPSFELPRSLGVSGPVAGFSPWNSGIDYSELTIHRVGSQNPWMINIIQALPGLKSTM